jgi:two-component system response regulator AtoC
LLQQVGLSDVPVLLQGETGVGKEVLARQLHAHSSRAQNRFLKLNCAALPPDLVESELFGYERGAFTGAFRDRPGKFEMARGGTILLDEIGVMDLRLQEKLLQVLQDSEFQRLGSSETVPRGCPHHGRYASRSEEGDSRGDCSGKIFTTG